MSDVEYDKLNRQQKLALFLITIGPEASAEVLREFEEPEVESLCREMNQFSMVSDELRRQVAEDFSDMIGESVISTRGGMAFARETLTISHGDYKAKTILGRVGADPSGGTVDVVDELAEMDARQIYNLIKHEQPQTVSFILSYLPGAKSSEVFSLLGPEAREEVVERLGTIESTSVELVTKIVRNLGKHFDRKSQPSYHSSGGVRSVADLLNGLDKETSKNLLGRLEERNPQLGSAIRRKLFSFDDLSRLTASDLQRVLREVESSSLAVAMKSAPESLREQIYGAISKRAAESLKDEIEMLGPVRVKDVEVAQDAIIQIVRRLEEEGAISTDGSEAAVVN